MQPSESPLPQLCLDPLTVPFQDEHGIWNVFSAKDVRAVLKQGSRDTSSRLACGEQNPVVDFLWATEDVTLGGEPGRHAVLRSVAADWFSTRASRTMGPRIRDITIDLVERVITRGDEPEGWFNLAESIAYAVPLRVACGLVGVPLSDEPWLRSKLRELSRAGYANLPPQPEVRQYFMDLAKTHHAGPGDLFTVLVNAREDGRITEEELIGYLYGLTLAATGTTGTHLANIFSIAGEKKLLGTLWEIADDPFVLHRAMSEFLRFMVPVPARQLTLPHGVVLAGGEQLPAGAVARAWLSAACRDSEVNGGVPQASPNELILSRSPNRHLALGKAAHHCMGADLQAQVAMTVLTLTLRLLPGLRPAAGDWFRRRLVNPESIVHEVTEAWFVFDRVAAVEALRRYRGY